MIKLTPAALQAIKAVLESDPDCQGKLLRVAVKGGGCSGYKYALDFDDPDEDDVILDVGDGLDVCMDAHSLTLLTGTTIDYRNELREKGFVFINPSAKTTCGCGQSWSG